VLGSSVDTRGDLVVVGSPFDDPPAGDGAGSVCVYEVVAPGVFDEHKLTASDGSGTDALGWSVATDGRRVIAGAVFDQDPQPRATHGSAYVFDRRPGGAN
jgi:FG-GAP repeat